MGLESPPARSTTRSRRAAAVHSRPSRCRDRRKSRDGLHCETAVTIFADSEDDNPCVRHCRGAGIARGGVCLGVRLAGRECATQKVMPCVEATESIATGIVRDRLMTRAIQYPARNILRQQLDLNIPHGPAESIDNASGNGASSD